MTPEVRRAHLMLHGQTLLDEWTEVCGFIRDARIAHAGGRFDASHDMYTLARTCWRKAVAKEGCTMQWDGAGCVLSNGERYEYPDP